MRRRDLILLVVASAALGGATFFGWRAWSEQDSVNLPQGTFWVCADCKHEFVLSATQVLEGRACPKCGGQNTLRAIRCPGCGGIFVPQDRGQPVCPKCNQPLARFLDAPPEGSGAE